MKKPLIGIIFLCLGGFCLAEMPLRPLEAGDAFPQFTAVDIYGKEINIGKLKGRVVVISIASFDQAQKRTNSDSAEAKKLGDFYMANMPNALEVIRISSKSKVPFFVSKSFVESRARKACKRDNDPWPVIIDWDSSLKGLLKMADSPLTFIIDKSGIIRYKKNGFLAADDEVRELIGKLI